MYGEPFLYSENKGFVRLPEGRQEQGTLARQTQIGWFSYIFMTFYSLPFVNRGAREVSYLAKRTPFLMAQVPNVGSRLREMCAWKRTSEK